MNSFVFSYPTKVYFGNGAGAAASLTPDYLNSHTI